MFSISIRFRMVDERLAVVNTEAYGQVMNEKQTLDKTLWIQAGFRALSERGPEALKAESLARELGVSKGSFYWHFANLPVFKEAMVEYWVAMATRGIIDAVEASSTKPEHRLLTLVDLASAPPPDEVGGPRAEGAIRCWGRADAAVGERLRAVDQARIDYCIYLFQQSGKTQETAALHGRLLYCALIGLEQLDQAGLAQLRRDLQGLLKILM